MARPTRSMLTRPRHDVEIRIDGQLGSERAGAELRARKVQIVLLLELVIGKLIARGHADAARPARRIDEVDARRSRPLRRRLPRIPAPGAPRRSRAARCRFPCRTTPALRRSGPARAGRLRAQPKHPHAVGQSFDSPPSLRVHPVPARGAAIVRQARSDTRQRAGSG